MFKPYISLGRQCSLSRFPVPKEVTIICHCFFGVENELPFLILFQIIILFLVPLRGKDPNFIFAIFLFFFFFRNHGNVRLIGCYYTSTELHLSLGFPS